MKKNTPDSAKYLLARFEESFNLKQNSSIAFYGFGKTSKMILDYTTLEFNNMYFIEQGERKAGELYENVPIIRLNDVPQNVDFVIILSDIGYYSVILHRIMSCGVKIYSIDGYCGQLTTEDIFYKELITLSHNIQTKNICCLVEKKLTICDGYYSIDNLYQLGYAVFGPIVYYVLCYIYEEWKAGKYKELLFVARDGYLFLEDYYFWLDTFHLEMGPKVIYLLASTRVLYIAGITNDEEIEAVRGEKFSGTIGEYFNNKLGFEVPYDDESRDRYVRLPEDKAILDVFLSKHKKEIYKNIENERAEYIKYLDSLEIGADYAILDNGFTGYSAYQFEKILQKQYKKAYFLYKSKYSKYCNDRIDAMCQTNDSIYKLNNMYQDFALLEAVFSAPYGSVIKFENGVPCYKKQDVNFDNCIEVNKGIKHFILDIANMDIDTTEFIKDGIFVDELYGLLMHNTLWKEDFEEKLKRGKSF